MKKLILALLLSISTAFVFAQNKVDVELINNPTNCELNFYIPNSEVSLLSNITFTLRWKSSENIFLGIPQPTNLIAINKSGQTHTIGGWTYQIYSGYGFTPGLIPQLVSIVIPKTGKGNITISNDYFVSRPNINGSYYVSINGQDVTGDVLIAKDAESIDEPLPIIMYFDPFTKQFYLKKDGIYYDMIGQRVTPYNTTELIVIRKHSIK